MSGSRIEREEKNKMRKKLEETLSLYRLIEEKINIYQGEAVSPEYQTFWQNLKKKNADEIKEISRYMAIKCNR